MEREHGKTRSQNSNTTREIHTKYSCRGCTFDMARGLPKSLPPCSRKPHGPPPLSEAVYVVPAISQYSRTGSNIASTRHLWSPDYRTNIVVIHSSHNRAAGGATFWLAHEQQIDNGTWLVLDTPTPTELLEERTIQKYFSKKVNFFSCKNMKKLCFQNKETFFLRRALD